MARDTLRAQFFDDVRGQIKRVALEQLAGGGPGAVSVNAVGRELGVSGPALYRYVRSRDELLTALIIDAYDALAVTTREAVGRRRTPQGRRRAYVAAYRGWAIEQPHRYRLLFREPLPGFQPNTDELVRSSQAVMQVLLQALHDCTELPCCDGLDVSTWMAARGLPAAMTTTARSALALWARLHGIVTLELEGCYASMEIDPAALYLCELGVPASPAAPRGHVDPTRPDPRRSPVA